MHHPTPREVADRQLQAYNAHDIDAFSALFAEDAAVFDLASGAVRAEGREAIRALYSGLFSENPDLRCTVFQRIDLGDFAIDREELTGLASGPVQIVALYEVREGLIRTVRFIRHQGQ